MAPTNRSKSRKTEVVKTHKFSKTTDTDQKFSRAIDTELKHMKKPVIVSPPRIGIKSNDNTTESKCTLSSFGIKPAPRKQFSHTRQTKLKCCVIETPEKNSIIFRF